MTKEEAISRSETNAINATGTLGGLPLTAAEKSSLNRQIEALDMAIAALEREKIYKSTLFKISETVVDESKLHITPEKACEKIREYLKQKDLKLSQMKEVKE